MHRPLKASRAAAAIVLTALLIPQFIAAQTTGGSGRSTEQMLGRSAGTKKTSGFGNELAPIERAIDPARYQLGPNDQLIVSIPALESLSDGGEFPVVVSADYSVGLPRGVVVDTRGMTLDRFRREVEGAYRRRGGALAQDIAVWLVRPRSIYVSVRGDVINPNRFVLTAADRITTAIDLANRIEAGTPEAELDQIARTEGQKEMVRTGSRHRSSLSKDQMPIRTAIVRHNDGTSDHVDLVRYQAFGDDADNPTLREGDEIFVARPDPTRSSVAIGGAVGSQLVVPYMPGDNALLLVRLAGGAQPQARSDSAYIARIATTGQSTIPINISDSSALSRIELQPGDRIVVPYATRLTGAAAGFVTVRGAVVRPSMFPIVDGETRLSEVIAAAGGFTPDASINGAHITRSMDPAGLKLTSDTDPLAGISSSSLKLEDTTRFKYDRQLQQDRASADFVRLFERHDPSADVRLRIGDEIVVPQNPQSIYVSGRVALPGAVDFVNGQGVQYYIERAGGATSAADMARAQVIRFGTGQMVDAEGAVVLPGDEIYIPGERDTPARTSLETASTVAAIISSATAVTLWIVQIINELKK